MELHEPRAGEPARRNGRARMDAVLEEMAEVELDDLAEAMVALLLSGHRSRGRVVTLPTVRPSAQGDQVTDTK